MRRGNNPKRSRGHARSNGRKAPNPNRSIESNAPDGGKVRGNPAQLYERYTGLARDAQGAGDRVGAEAFLQYAEHYYRILNAQGPRRNGPAESGDAAARESSAGGNGHGGGNGSARGSEEQLRAGGNSGDDATEEGTKEPEPAVN